ncbi:MAG: hypothetical protein ACTSO7_12610 [Candidatus Heimdallarchaeota archaeon]
MTDEKKSRGRPRIYPTNAARKKAYRERKKAERQELIERVEKLEKEIGSKDEKVSAKKLDDPILNLSLAKIESMTTNELQDIVEIVNKKFPIKRDLFSPLSIIVNDIIESSDPLGFNSKVKIGSNKVIADEVQKNYREFEHSLSYLTILNVVESVIASREHRDTTDYELEILEQKITELEQAVAKKKEEELEIKK